MGIERVGDGAARGGGADRSMELNIEPASGTVSFGYEPLGGRPARSIRRVRQWVSGHLVLLFGAAALALLAADSVARVSADAPTQRATLETVMTLFAFAAAWLVRAEFLHERRVRDLLLLSALLMLGLIGLCTYAVPAALDLRAGSYLAAAAMWGELFAAGLVAAAAFAPAQARASVRWHNDVFVAAVALGGLVAAELGALLTPGALIGGSTAVARADHTLVLRPLAVVLVLGTTALMLVAAAGFTRREKADCRGTASLFAAAALLLAAARFSHLTGGFPPDRVALTSLLRPLGFTLILIAAVRQELRMRASVVKAAAMAERQRVARDLHDGLAQDLAFIAAHGERIAQEMGAEHPVVIAARRALAVSRGAIAKLSDPDAPTTRAGLESVARELSDRFHIDVAVDVDLRRELAAEAREHIARITREAIANAARHGGAENVMVSLKDADSAVTLAVRDDGCGIEKACSGPAREGFGLRSIRERATELGGQLSIAEREARGTVLKVSLP
jgi:signal transduction histidine kinase